MGGGDLNLKKSWHPQTRENQEKLWLARQAKAEEDKKLAILKKELEEQRQVEELQRLQQGSKKKLDRMDWMYAGSASSSTQSAMIQEEYLLGKRKITDISEDNLNFSSSDDMGTKNTNDYTTCSARDMETKLREDPLFIIKKKEQLMAKQLASNPIKMKRLQLADSIRSNISSSTPVQKMKTPHLDYKCNQISVKHRNGIEDEKSKLLEEMQRDASQREKNLRNKTIQHRQQESAEQVSVRKDYESRHLEKNFLKKVEQDTFSTKSHADLSTRLNSTRMYHDALDH